MLTKRRRNNLVHGLARAFVAGDWTPSAMAARAEAALAGPWQPIRPLARRLAGRWPAGAPAVDAVVDALHADFALSRAMDKKDAPARIVSWAPPAPAPDPIRWDLPSFDSPRAVADWLRLEIGELRWLANCDRRRAADGGPLHYRWRWLPKRSGGRRLIEAPKPMLRSVQRAVNTAILSQVPPHPAACGFHPGGSIRRHAAAHAGKEVVMTLDLCAFFAYVPATRVHAFFHCLGYTRDVARLLTGLTTTCCRLPADVTGHEALLRQPHLPQGAPTSPPLASFCARGLDRRLAGLAGAVGCAYTRYGDDLAFSGAYAQRLPSLLPTIWRIVREEGFDVQHRKTRVAGRSRRQRVTGVVVNDRPNICRRDCDQLKAILTNCLRTGPAAQNRQGHQAFRAHLQGRVAHVQQFNAARGQRLQALLDRIDWSGD
jgi:hypothetical protein